MAAVDGELEELGGIGRAAVAEPVRAERVAGEQQRTRGCRRSVADGAAGAVRSRPRRPGPAQASTPASRRGARASRRRAAAPDGDSAGHPDRAGDEHVARRRGRATAAPPLARAWSAPVITAPPTSTLVTIVAGARCRAANQVADVAGEDEAGEQDPGPRLGRRARGCPPSRPVDGDVADEHDEPDREASDRDDRRGDPAQDPPDDDDLDRPAQGGERGSASRRSPHAMPRGGSDERLADGERRRGPRSGPARGARRGSGTARMATQTNIVFWMNAADGALAMARPVKKSRNAMPPPTTPDDDEADPARRLDPARRPRGRTSGAATARRTIAATRVLEGRVDGGVGHLLDGERVELDGQPADARGDHGEADAPADRVRDRGDEPQRADPAVRSSVTCSSLGDASAGGAPSTPAATADRIVARGGRLDPAQDRAGGDDRPSRRRRRRARAGSRPGDAGRRPRRVAVDAVERDDQGRERRGTSGAPPRRLARAGRTSLDGVEDRACASAGSAAATGRLSGRPEAELRAADRHDPAAQRPAADHLGQAHDLGDGEGVRRARTDARRAGRSAR